MVTASRIDLDWTEDRMYIDEGILSEHITNVSAQASNWDGFLEIGVQELRNDMLEFRRASTNFSVRSEQEIRSLFENSGFFSGVFFRKSW